MGSVAQCDQTGRIFYVDAIRGFGMICVILGHTRIPEIARQFIFSFHMPLFFIFFLGGGLFVLQRISMASGSMGNPFLAGYTALSFISLFFLFFRKYFSDNKILHYIGRHSLLFMMLHAWIPVATQPLFQNANRFWHLMERPLLLVGLIFLVWFIDRYLPFLAGKYQRKS